jgi:ferric-dicitrate binding protein FerR (iron transport regulator)
MRKMIFLFCWLVGPALVFAMNGKNNKPVSPAPDKDIALVLKTTGQVQVNGNDGAWQNAARGTRLNAGTQVRTGDQSLAAIVFTDDKSLLKVRSNSKVVINGKREPAASGGQRILKTIAMEFGELWAKVTKGNTAFRVETPSGVAAVKGTIFYSILRDDGRLYIICFDGIVELINRFGSVLVQTGQTGTSTMNEAPEAHPSTPEEIPNWANDSEGSGEIEIEFQDQNGQKKKLKIRYE